MFYDEIFVCSYFINKRMLYLYASQENNITHLYVLLCFLIFSSYIFSDKGNAFFSHCLCQFHTAFIIFYAYP